MILIQGIHKKALLRIQKMVLEVKIDQVIAEKMKVKTSERFFWDTM